MAIKTANKSNNKEKQSKMKKVIEEIKVEEVKISPAPRAIHVIAPPTYGEQEEIDSNDVYDDGDIASALERGFIAHALTLHKEKVAAEKHPDFDGESCLDCGAEIPELRLEMGRIRCVDCQTALELKNKMFGRR